MGLRINDVAPDFTADTTEGPISFHEWIGDGWAILFSHPRAFTPVCTTELGYMQGIAPEFAKRGAKILGVSVDPIDNHDKWKGDIETATGQRVTYPLIGDPELKIAKLYEMLPAEAPDSWEGRTPADNATVRTVFIIGPDKKVKLQLTYPMTTGRNFDEILRALDFDPADGQAWVGDPGAVEAGRRRHRHRRGLRRGRREALRRLHPGAAVPAHDAAAAGVSPASGCSLRIRAQRPAPPPPSCRPCASTARRACLAPRRRAQPAGRQSRATIAACRAGPATITPPTAGSGRL